MSQFKIKHIMILAVLVALGLAASRADRREALAVAFASFSLLALWPLFLLFRPSPLRGLLDNPPGDEDELLASLERGLARPPGLDFNTDARARFHLMQMYKVRKRYEEALAQGRKILALRGLTHAFETEVRLEIAVCLDFLGRGDEADAERQAAEETLGARPVDALGWLVQGKLFDKEHRYLDAAKAYERALDLYPPENTAVRDDLLIRLVLATFNAGRPGETVKWAEKALALEIAEPRRYQANRMAGVAYANLGRLDEAERHHRDAHALALESGETQKVSDCLASLAEVRRARGDLAGAEAICLEAESLDPALSRQALTIHAVVLRHRGQLDQALERLEAARRIGVLASAYFERRTQAVLGIWVAAYKAELGRLDEAWSELRTAGAALEKDAKLRLICEAARVRLVALGGDRDGASRGAEAVLGKLEDFRESSSTQLDCLDLLGRALIGVGDHERAARCWGRYLEVVHPPVSEPIGWYYLGVCRRDLGDLSGAAEAFSRALEPGIDSQHARLARQGLEELSRGPADRA